MSDRPLVLVTDDDRLITEITAELLQRFGVDSVSASSGEEAVSLVKYLTERKSEESRLAFILVDHVMPEMDGPETIRKIRQLCDTPVYGLSGSFTDQTKAEFVEAGAVDLVTKPVSPNVMYKILGESLPDGTFTVPGDLVGIQQELPEESKNDSLLRNCLKGIQGLNYARGFKYALNDEASYIRNLSEAGEDMERYCMVLEGYVHDSDISALRIAVHSLKTIFMIIGIKLMYHDSEELESTIEKMIVSGQSKMPNILFYEHVNTYKNNVRQISDGIKKALEEYERILTNGAAEEENDDEAPKLLDARDMAEVMAYTLTALERFEYDYIMEGLEILRKAYPSETRKRVEKAIEAVKKFDYDTAKDTVKELSVQS